MALRYSIQTSPYRRNVTMFSEDASYLLGMPYSIGSPVVEPVFFKRSRIKMIA